MKLVAFITLLTSFFAFAAEEDMIKNRDSRITLSACGLNSEDNSNIKKVCVGETVSSKQNLLVVTLKSGAIVKYLATFAKPQGFGEQEFGRITYKITLKKLDQNLSPIGRASSAQLLRSWEWSE